VVDLTVLLADLHDEGAELDALVRDLPETEWSRTTPAPGWTIAHQVAHLAWTDDRALLAGTDPDAFHAEAAAALATGQPVQQWVDDGAEQGATAAPARLLARWRRGRDALASALAALPAGSKLPWYGPPMGPASMATARLMETWAHGTDIAEALGVRRQPTARLRHVAHLGVRTRDFAFSVRQLPPPTDPFRVELTAPDGSIWTWGPDHATQTVTGPALDFCLLVVQRIHRDDTALTAVGADANRWLGIAQAFAGPPGAGRQRQSNLTQEPV
jgi:uncharacterized protein (TIGR03084 family)